MVSDETNFLDATKLTANVENPTTVILLTGMSMAATSGVRCPLIATLNAMALYINDIAKPVFKMAVDDAARVRNRSNDSILSP